MHRGATYFSPAVAKLVRHGFSAHKDARVATQRHEDPFDSLTERERLVYQLLAEGNCNKDIANRLELSLHTVETHRWRIMEK